MHPLMVKNCLALKILAASAEQNLSHPEIKLTLIHFQDLYSAKTAYEKSMSEFRTPEIKALLSGVEKKIKEEERKAYIDPVKAEEEKEKGNELFKNGV
jgi:hypothetical protein